MDSNLRRSRHSVTEWANLSRCERLYAWGYLGRAPIEAQISDWTDASQERDSAAALLGTEIHAALAGGRFDEVRRLGYGSLADWAEGREAPVACWNELAFELSLEGEVLVGAMDRVELSEAGIYTLLDFKILQSQKSDEALREAYRLPMELYAYALGQLEPTARGRLRALLVCATRDSLREIEVPLPGPESLARSFDARRQLAVAAVGRSETGGPEIHPPNPGGHCRVCRYRPHCVEGN